MIRELPIIEFAGIAFYVDVQQDEFRQVTNPENTIPFDFLESSDEAGLSLAFDKQTLSAYMDELDTVDLPAYVEVIHIPSLVSIDPVGIARKGNLPDNFFTEE